MDATEWEQRFILNRLPHPLHLAEWDGEAERFLAIWLESRPRVDFTDVRRRVTRRFPQFRDFDLTAKYRARAGQQRFETGCDGDVVIEGAFGFHVTNRGAIHDRMWYGRWVAIVTQRCHEGHDSHFVSWRLPSGHDALSQINGRLVDALSPGCWDPILRLKIAYQALAARA